MGNHSGNVFASIPGSGFQLSTASGSNPFNKSRREFLHQVLQINLWIYLEIQRQTKEEDY